MTRIILWYPQHSTAKEALRHLYNAWLIPEDMNRAHKFDGTEEEAIKLIRQLEGEASAAYGMWRAYQ